MRIRHPGIPKAVPLRPTHRPEPGRVVLSSYGPQNLGLFVDNVYFSAVPGPATLVALGLGTALTRSRRRR